MLIWFWFLHVFSVEVWNSEILLHHGIRHGSGGDMDVPRVPEEVAAVVSPKKLAP